MAWSATETLEHHVEDLLVTVRSIENTEEWFLLPQIL